jgi:transcriptional regulator with XRE-family HTH domain
MTARVFTAPEAAPAAMAIRGISMKKASPVGARRIEPHDIEVGRRIRIRRLERQMSQTELAVQLGVTFQQVQKYEKGVNRVGAARLQRIADALEVPISFFFSAPERGSQREAVMPFLESPHAIRLMRAFARISDPAVQRSVLELVERIARLD